MTQKLNWEEFDRGVFLLNVLAIILKEGKVLLGKRVNDLYFKELSQSFPGGRPAYDEDLEYYLKLEVKKKTNLEIEPVRVIFARTYPGKRQFLSIYYLCKLVGGEEKAGEKFTEIKWVDPEELKNYLPPIDPKLYKIILDYAKKKAGGEILC